MSVSAQMIQCACASAAFRQAKVSLVLSKQTVESKSFCLAIYGGDDVIVITQFAFRSCADYYLSNT